nr:MAG TPA: hypothetical protein [Caudoviricetes sp.]
MLRLAARACFFARGWGGSTSPLPDFPPQTHY